MIPSEIEAYAYEVIYPDCDGELFFTLYLAKERAAEVGGDIRKLHTPEQMQEYAKEAVRGFAAHISLYEIGEDWPNTVAENYIKKEFGDTKND